MAADLSDIRDGIKDRLEHIAGLNAVEYTPDRIGEPPAAVIRDPVIDYNRSFGGANSLTMITFPVQVLVWSADAEERTDALDAFTVANGTGVKTAIEGDRTLGGLVETLHVPQARPLDRNEVAEIGFWGAELDCVVYARGF